MTQTIELYEPQSAYQAITRLWVEVLKPALIQGRRMVLTVKPATRSLEQNALFWSCLTDLSEQVEWPVDGRAQRLTAEEWKHILSAGLKKHQRVAAGIEGGFVMLGQSTSKLSVSEMSELITLAHAFGDQHGVTWCRTSLGRDVPDEVH